MEFLNDVRSIKFYLCHLKNKFYSRRINNMDNGFLKREGGHEGGPSLLID